MLGKSTLLEMIAGKNRGILTNDLQKQAILSAVAQLEDRNPTPYPLEAADKLDGNWRLLYTTSEELLQIDRFPFLKLGQIYQYIRAEGTKIYNIAEVAGVPYLEGLVSVAAKFEPVSDRRVKINFERGIVGLQRLIGYRSVIDFIQEIESGKKFTAIDFNITNREQKGWLDITYLDDDLRIGRGNEGNIFVLTKVP
ncbi:fibrillin [filamentous cyanobacterium CCP2]|nr:fibrillin [filamentous cyanobacterium CCP2]